METFGKLRQWLFTVGFLLEKKCINKAKANKKN